MSCFVSSTCGLWIIFPDNAEKFFISRLSCVQCCVGSGHFPVIKWNKETIPYCIAGIIAVFCLFLFAIIVSAVLLRSFDEMSFLMFEAVMMPFLISPNCQYLSVLAVTMVDVEAVSRLLVNWHYLIMVLHIHDCQHFACITCNLSNLLENKHQFFWCLGIEWQDKRNNTG